MDNADAIAIELLPQATDEVRSLIGELDRTLAAEYPPEQRHGLALDAIFQPNMRCFLARLNGAAAGCGEVALFADFAEVKRMYVREGARGRGVAQALLAQLETVVRAAGLTLLRLETGVRQPAAITLYRRAGFRPCPPFGVYAALPAPAIKTSLCLEKRLTA